uniref:Vascular endothelial growth factor Ab n=1 Tax=Gasterosteus aculeatus aculeatus TaxID=481459 RepID=A0AAQ4PF06_GASAC
MNFIDSLTLLFLTLSAVKSAHIPRGTERGPHDAIPLMEVYNKSLCQPRELLVEILQEYPEEVEHIFIPSCVVLTRCAGCCSDEMMQCVPTSSYNVTMEIKRIKPQRQQNDFLMSFTEHSASSARRVAITARRGGGACSCKIQPAAGAPASTRTPSVKNASWSSTRRPANVTSRGDERGGSTRCTR